CALGLLRERAAPAQARISSADSAALRRERGEDRQGQSWPRSALPVRGAAAPARLSGGAQARAARRPRFAAGGSQGQVTRDGDAPQARRNGTEEHRYDEVSAQPRSACQAAARYSIAEFK